jgi:hypothetical protein
MSGPIIYAEQLAILKNETLCDVPGDLHAAIQSAFDVQWEIRFKRNAERSAWRLPPENLCMHSKDGFFDTLHCLSPNILSRSNGCTFAGDEYFAAEAIDINFNDSHKARSGPSDSIVEGGIVVEKKGFDANDGHETLSAGCVNDPIVAAEQGIAT